MLLLRSIFLRTNTISLVSACLFEAHTVHLVKQKIHERRRRALTALLCCYNTTGSKMQILNAQSQWATSLQHNKSERNHPLYVIFVVVLPAKAPWPTPGMHQSRNNYMIHNWPHESCQLCLLGFWPSWSHQSKELDPDPRRGGRIFFLCTTKAPILRLLLSKLLHFAPQALSRMCTFKFIPIVWQESSSQ